MIMERLILLTGGPAWPGGPGGPLGPGGPGKPLCSVD